MQEMLELTKLQSLNQLAQLQVIFFIICNMLRPITSVCIFDFLIIFATNAYNYNCNEKFTIVLSNVTAHRVL